MSRLILPFDWLNVAGPLGSIMAVQFSLCGCMCAVNSGAGASVYDHTTTKSRGEEGKYRGQTILFYEEKALKCEKKPALI